MLHNDKFNGPQLLSCEHFAPVILIDLILSTEHIKWAGMTITAYLIINPPRTFERIKKQLEVTQLSINRQDAFRRWCGI